MPAEDPISIEWNTCRRPQWDRLLTAAGRSSLEQSWSYGEAMAACYGQTVDRAVIRRDGAPLAMVQTFRKPAFGLAAIVRIARGPLWLTDAANGPARIEVYRALRNAFSLRRREALFWLPELTDTPESHALMRAAGTRRMVTGLHSAWLNLTPEADELRAGLAGKWRNALCAAEGGHTKVRISTGPGDLPALMTAYDGFRKRKRFVGPPGRLVTAIAEAGRRTKDALVVTALSGGEMIAGIVLIRHGACATYYVGWTGAEGRRRNAHNLLLWRGILELKKSGTARLDLGGMNTASAAGVARFKLGLNPEVFTLAGTYF